MSVTQQQVLAAIADLPGPDASKTLAKSGALGGVNVRDGKVFVSINVEPGKVQALEPMRGRVESVIKKLPGVAAAYVTLTSDAEQGGGQRAQPVRSSGAARPAAKGGAPRASARSLRSPPARAASASRPRPATSRSPSSGRG